MPDCDRCGHPAEEHVGHDSVEDPIDVERSQDPLDNRAPSSCNVKRCGCEDFVSAPPPMGRP